MTEQLVALNADIVGFSSLMADDPENTTAIVDSYRTVVAEKVSNTGGTLLDFVGDNFMAVFEDPVDAIGAAISIARHVEDRNADLPTEKWVRFRMGLDRGEVESRGGNHFGDALNIAARVQTLARPGGISVTGRVFRALDEPELRFRSTGSHTLKNIPEPVDVYEFVGLPTDGLLSGIRGGRRLVLQNPTLVVLPLLNHGLDSRVEALCEIFRSDLIHRLSEIPQLTIIDTSASDTATYGQATYIVDVGALQIGEVVRGYGKVMEQSTFNIVTSHKCVTTVSEMLERLESFIEEIARSVEIELIVGERALLYETVNDPDTIRKIYNGWHHLNMGTPEGWDRAKELFEEVAESHPDYIYGRTLLAFTNYLGALEGFSADPSSLMEAAFDQAMEAVEMGDPTGMGQMIQGAIYISQGRADEALEAIEAAQVIRPTCDLTYAVEGSVRRYLGQWEKSVEALDKAMRLAVISPPWYPTVQACSLFIGHRLEAAGTTAEEVLEQHPDTLEALIVLTAVQVEQGLERRARATAQVIKERFPTVDINLWLDQHPYQDPDVVERWRRDLEVAGLLGERQVG